MEKTQIILYLATFLSIILLSKFSHANDSINSNQTLKYGNTLVSSGQTFELGFFSPGKSSNIYLGIWYKNSPQTIVWVANKNSPLADSQGELAIHHGNLVLRNRTRGFVLWESSNSSSSSFVTKKPVAQLLDSGNLVLRENETDLYIWQSFDHPTDTMLSGMKLGRSSDSEFDRYLMSWKSSDDPSTGEFRYGIEVNGLPQVVLTKGTTRKFRLGPWNGVRFVGLSKTTLFKAFNLITNFEENNSYFMVTPNLKSELTHITVNSSGSMYRFTSHNRGADWAAMFSLPYQLCDQYGHCGPNGICRLKDDPVCECLEGSVPVSVTDWELMNWSRGCKRNSPLDCRKGEGFVMISGINLPDLLNIQLNKSMSLEECEEMCLRDCSCTAYANSDMRNGGSGCLIWIGDLMDMKELVKGGDQQLYVRQSVSEMKLIHAAKKSKRLIILVSATIGVCLSSLIIICIFRKWKSRARMKEANGKRGEQNDEIDLPLFKLGTMRTATKDFSPENMIGEGGFGPVYKGILSNGKEIAVKRLSKNSRQGTKEFKNEVELIAKLQHKNLVALLGCCVEGDERILIYEYLPCKSLDHYIFDKERSNLSSWEKNFDILMGIARGLLYLHQDSKLPIIHRDLKASNILLDRNMNPKISDFGLARIFAGDEIESKTNTIVGTYGYISPEYLIHGLFSMKSDVFSFGVMLLEIVSGKKNRKFNDHDDHNNLIGHAWMLWIESRAIELIDECFDEISEKSQVLRCIQVGLLCVQKSSEDRPTMNSVLLMLSNNEMKLPKPKEPGFVTTSSSNTNQSPTSTSDENHSENRMTITLYGR